jgi:hypothetical protein
MSFGIATASHALASGSVTHHLRVCAYALQHLADRSGALRVAGTPAGVVGRRQSWRNTRLQVRQYLVDKSAVPNNCHGFDGDYLYVRLCRSESTLKW